MIEYDFENVVTLVSNYLDHQTLDPMEEMTLRTSLRYRKFIMWLQVGIATKGEVMLLP